MKLRQAEKILKRISICARDNNYYGTPLPRNWRRYMCLWHKANAVYNHHAVPFGREANRWANAHMAKMCKAAKLHEQQYQEYANS